MVHKPMFYSLHKIKRLLRQDGVKLTSKKVVKHGRNQIRDNLCGLPGHFTIRKNLLKRRYHDEDVIDTISVNPNRITYLTGTYERRGQGHLDYVPHFKPREASWDYLPYDEEVPFGSVRTGNWDQSTTRFSDLIMFKGAKQRYIEGLPWVETIYHQKLCNLFEQEGWNPVQALDLATKRCDALDQLYNNIESGGYRSQQELNGFPLHEVTITIGRDGEPRYNCEGRHRLTIAKLLDVEEIPVLVLVTHKEYEGEPADVGI